MLSAVWQLVKRGLSAWFGDFTKEEVKKFLFLGVIFSLLIGIYWTLRPMKDSFFGTLVVGLGKGQSKQGRDMFLAIAKVVSLLMLVPIVTLYGALVERFKKSSFFYILTVIYAVLMAVWMFVFLDPNLGLANTVPSTWRISGWLWYVFVESFGSLIIALFWAIVVDTTTSDSAKRGFALIVMIGQLGGIIMPKYLSRLPKMFGFSPAIVVGLCGIFVLLASILFWLYINTIPAQVKVVTQSKKNDHVEPGLMEGLRLVLSHKYLLGIFGILFFFEFIATIIDFNFKIMTFAEFSDPAAANAFLSDYGSWVNLVAFACLFFGINNIPRKLGIKAALGLVPLIVAGAVTVFYFSPSLDVLFWLIVGAKAINYALNGPSIKQLYIPTSEDVKYKSQAWIETFGSRASKAAASFSNFTKDIIGFSLYLSLTVAASLGLSAIWFFTALYLANTYNRAIERDEIVC